MAAGGFSSVHGSNRACRGANASDNSAAYYDLFAGKADLEDCKAQCMETLGCVGIEFHSRGRCEVWKRPEGIGATAEVMGFDCFRFTPDMAATTRTTTAVPGFTAADGGENRVCRGATSTDNSATYYDLFMGTRRTADCKARCIETRGCVGIEFHSNGRCEVWKRPGGIGATAEVMGFECFRYTADMAETTHTTTAVPGFTAADGGENRVCRGATSTDNSAKYYQLFETTSNLESCKALCVGTFGCVGIEFQAGGRCEVWTRPGGIGATAGASGYQCLRYEPLSLLRHGAKLRGGATRKSPSLDAMGTSYFQANATLSKVQLQQAGEICQEKIL